MQLPVLVNSARPLAAFDTVTVQAPIICFSHLRWDFVTQRPQHLMRRFGAKQRVFFWEEHIPCEHGLPYLEFHAFPDDNIIALRPRLPRWWDAAAVEAGLRGLLEMLVATALREPPILWVYAPVMFGFASHLDTAAVVYDCMDELAAFRFADPQASAREARLIKRADVMFTGGHSLYDAKQRLHGNIHAFPSAVDIAHFVRARNKLAVPEDQESIPFPRLGYYGVIDERLDLDLIDAAARLRPDWSFVMVGPTAKIDPGSLPRRSNIYWLGGRSYADLPAYLAGWDVALMPFAMNQATRFISPTKTPEYLAGGRPVVSTPIVDVVRHYGDLEGVRIAGSAEAFVTACQEALALPKTGPWLRQADRLLAGISWDQTFGAMQAHVAAAINARQQAGDPVARQVRQGSADLLLRSSPRTAT